MAEWSPLDGVTYVSALLLSRNIIIFIDNLFENFALFACDFVPL